jgi:hypothetical protein
MSSRHRIEQLLQHPRIWRAGRAGKGRRVLPSGFRALDDALAGGWPLGQLIELFVDPCGIGELRLLLPGLIALGREPDAGNWVVLIAPPHIPYAPAFAEQGLDASRLLIVRCDRAADALWATEQALQSRTCGAVLAWAIAADERGMRRLQLAVEGVAETAPCLLVLFGPLRSARRRSPAALRIRAFPGDAGAITLQIIKNRGGRPRTVTIDPGSGAAG